MKPEDQIKALAELDGFINHTWIAGHQYGDKREPIQPFQVQVLFPQYLHSYDAIIPLIQKQAIEIRRDVYRNLIRDESGKIRHTVDIGDAYISNPALLCEALLRATGKWKE